MLAEMADVLEALFKRRGLPNDPHTAAAIVITELARYMGGQQVYLPRGDDLLRALRDRQIYRRLGPKTAAELASEYGLTDSQVYRIARTQRALRKKKREEEEKQ